MITSEAIQSLSDLSNDEFEAVAQKVANRFAEHDTSTTDFRSSQKYSGGELLWLMSCGLRSKAKDILIKVIGHYNVQWTEFCKDDDFADYVFGYLIHGCEMEVEWLSE